MPTNRLNKRDVIHLAFQGGYPESREIPEGPRRDWYRDYLSDLIKKDIREVTEIRNKNGKLVETWVYHELSAQASVSGEYEIMQYRDREKREIDFVVENGQGETLGIEVKAGAVGLEDFRHLKCFGTNLVKGKFIGIVLYAGDQILSFGNNLHAIPLACLG